jgi:hypothetical protein
MASSFWDGYIRVVVKDEAFWFLFVNTGSKYHGKGFEMLVVLNHHCHPKSVANAFTTLIMSIFTNVQGDLESILEFHSRVDGMVMEVLWCNVIIPPLLLMMIFLCALRSRYSDILDQFVLVTKFWRTL